MSQKISKIKISHAIKRTIIIIVSLIAIIFLIKIAPNYVKEAKIEETKLIINNNNVTNTLKSKLKIKDDTIYLSEEDIKNFFDEYIVEENNKIITTSNTKTVAIPKDINQGKMYINGSYIEIKNPIIVENNTTYIPISDLNEVYNYEINYQDKTNTVIIDSLNRKKVEAIASKKLNVKYKTTFLSKTIETIERGETVTILQSQNENKSIEKNGWVRIRTQSGNMGYVKKSDLLNENVVRENLEEEKIAGKVSLAWDYYNMYTVAPSRTEKIGGINIVSPSFYELKSDGTLVSNIGNSGEKYIEWAHSNNYKIWPTISNSMLNNLDAVSKMMSNFEYRANLIDNIVKALSETDVDGINIDFENMYKEDKDKYSRFIIELAPRLAEIGKKICVDVTAPDGSDTWSLCYDRNTIGKVADYIVFIGYDEHTASSKEAGTVAGADWQELNIKKFLGQEGIDSKKVILAMPFYTRLWTQQNGRVSSKVVNMNKVEIPSGVTKKWDENTKQNYIEYTSKVNGNDVTYKMWIEDEDSIAVKLDLVNTYNLAGAGFWELGRENSEVWNIAKDKLKVETTN